MFLQKFIAILLLTALCFASGEKPYLHLYDKMLSRDYDAVIKETGHLLDAGTSNTTILLLRARALYYEGHTFQALQVFKQAYEASPANDELAYEYASTLSRSGSTYQAAKIYREMYGRDSTDVSVIRPLAKLGYESGEYILAKEMYLELLALRKADYSAHWMLAKCCAKLGEHEAAAGHYQIAHELYPENFNIIYEHARHAYTRGNYEKALGLVKLGEEIRSDTMKLMLLKADIYFKQNEFTLAIPIYNQLLMRGLRSEDVYKRMGFAYYVIGAYPRAHELLSLAVEMGDEDAATYYYMAKCLEGSKKYEEAIATFEICLEKIQPKYLLDLHESLGSIYAVTDDYAKAIQHLSLAIEMNQESHLLMYFLADAYDNYYDDKSLALEYFKKAREGSISPRIDDYIDHRIQEINTKIFLKQ